MDYIVVSKQIDNVDLLMFASLKANEILLEEGFNLLASCLTEQIISEDERLDEETLIKHFP